MDDVSEQAQRAAANEALFRLVNERIAELNQTLSQFTERFVIVCECADKSCVEQLAVSQLQHSGAHGQ